MSDDVVKIRLLESTDPRVVTHIVRRDDGRLEVLSMEYTYQDVANRTSFGPGRPIAKVFDPSIVRAFEEAVNGVSGKAEVLSLPDFFVELPDLFLGCARVISAEPVDGQQSILVRFQRFFGSLNTLFTPELGFDTAIGLMTEDLAREMVDGVALPLLDEAEAAKVGVPFGTDPASTFVAVHNKAKAILDELSIIKRHTNMNSQNQIEG